MSVGGRNLPLVSAGYTEHDAARALPEPVKAATLPGHAVHRRAFARDRARVLHSAALRRLAGKTQVVGPGEGSEVNGIPRTRLTHSLEVAQISRELGEQLGCEPDVVDLAGLAHDIGHPPFGHNGETALHAVAAACGGFEANAQTLRILTRLEPKVLDERGRGFGLNLTRASLDAVTKYPWPYTDGRAKFGAYPDELAVFHWLREGAPDGTRCLEAQVMDWADDVAYSVHDVEDGVAAGRIALSALADRGERAAIAELAAKHFSAAPMSELEDAAAGLLRLPDIAALAAGYDASLGAQVAMKRLTSELVGRFVSAAVTSTRQRYGDGALLRYRAALTVPPRVAAEVALLKAVALRYVMSDETRLATQHWQRDVLIDLVSLLRERVPEALEPSFRPAWHAAADDAARLRVLIDQVAALTDAQAVAWHTALRGDR